MTDLLPLYNNPTRRSSDLLSFIPLTNCLALLLSLLKYISDNSHSISRNINSKKYWSHLQNSKKSSKTWDIFRIIRGDSTRGRFDLFCYAFVTMKGNEAFGYEIIRKLQEKHPTWKMNVKFDNDRQKIQRNQKQFGGNMPFPQQNNMSYPPYPPQMQRQPYPNYMHPNHMPLPVPQHNMPSLSEKIVGVKPCRIFVRELWLGGIPENYDKAQMAHIMSYYGIIEEI